MFEDITLQCKKPVDGVECEGTFVFTAGEQEFYAEKGFKDANGEIQQPQRCKTCRQAAKNARYNDR